MQSSVADLANQANQQMVDRLIAEGALWSRPLMAAFRDTPRHCFLDRVFQYQRKHNRWREILTRDLKPEDVPLLYSDRALITRLSKPDRQQPAMPISSSSQPSLMAQMLEELKLSRELRVLEIGAGTGYNAALLAHVVGPGLVTSVDVDRAVLAEAWDHLRAFPDRQISLPHADGRYGYAQAAPYDRIVVTAATPDLEPAWLEQLADRGLIQAPLALAPGLAFVVRGTVTRGIFHGRLTRAAYFMALRAENETGVSDLEPLPAAAELRSLPAPWAGWFERKRPRINWLGFSQSLAFYGWLRGLNVHYRTMDDNQPAYGVSAPTQSPGVGGQDEGALCWLGAQEWQVTGEAGRNLGWSLLRAFLDAGGPWPTEFRIRAAPGSFTLRSAPEDKEQAARAGPRETYLCQGPRCQQRWELIEPRDRPVWI